MSLFWIIVTIAAIALSTAGALLALGELVVKKWAKGKGYPKRPFQHIAQMRRERKAREAQVLKRKTNRACRLKA